ncbi:MAG: phosphatidylserine decarboxylase, partial [Steroidobacteraceae bacterium]|nr:phosphatidylserine decarboxylase [Steroidobacteraceae bacterium]MDW8260106.1 phosphatidylserine decarboxylase [Gammaproteobacteria bacterium]
MFARLWTYLLPLMPQHVLSRLIGACARVRVRWFKNTLIRAFVRAYRPDLSDALERDPLAYPSFNAFFTRALAPGVRPIEPHPATVVAPVDGTVSAI